MNNFLPINLTLYMDKSPKRYKTPKLTQEEIDNLNRQIAMKQIKFLASEFKKV